MTTNHNAGVSSTQIPRIHHFLLLREKCRQNHPITPPTNLLGYLSTKHSPRRKAGFFIAGSRQQGGSRSDGGLELGRELLVRLGDTAKANLIKHSPKEGGDFPLERR